MERKTPVPALGVAGLALRQEVLSGRHCGLGWQPGLPCLQVSGQLRPDDALVFTLWRVGIQ